MTQVLKDLKGQDFTEGDRVVYASRNGIRVGVVEWIKEIPRGYKVFINLSEHHNLEGYSRMLAKRRGYEYVPYHFLKVS